MWKLKLIIQLIILILIVGSVNALKGESINYDLRFDLSQMTLKNETRGYSSNPSNIDDSNKLRFGIFGFDTIISSVSDEQKGRIENKSINFSILNVDENNTLIWKNNNINNITIVFEDSMFLYQQKNNFNITFFLINNTLFDYNYSNYYIIDNMIIFLYNTTNFEYSNYIINLKINNELTLINLEIIKENIMVEYTKKALKLVDKLKVFFNKFFIILIGLLIILLLIIGLYIYKTRK